MSLRAAINAKCRDCIVDELDARGERMDLHNHRLAGGWMGAGRVHLSTPGVGKCYG